MSLYPITLTIAGSDSGGGAGIQADIKTFSAHNTFATSVITAVTAQNTQAVTGIQTISIDLIQKQLIAIFEDMPVAAVKIGMLGNTSVITAVAELLESYQPANIVLDPVMIAKSGDHLLEPVALDQLIHRLLPLATVITPNLPEALALLKIVSNQTEITSGELLGQLALLTPAVLLKGGHYEGPVCEDLLWYENTIHCFSHPRIETRNTHGTGCTLSSAIAANLAHGQPLPLAVSLATDYVHQAIQHARKLDIGEGHGPLHHFYDWWNR